MNIITKGELDSLPSNTVYAAVPNVAYIDNRRETMTLVKSSFIRAKANIDSIKGPFKYLQNNEELILWHATK